MGAALCVARDSHLCASITDDHSWVHLVRVLDAALTDKQVGKGREREAAGWMMSVVGGLAAAAAASTGDVARRLAGIIYPSPASLLCVFSLPTDPRSSHP